MAPHQDSPASGLRLFLLILFAIAFDDAHAQNVPACVNIEGEWSVRESGSIICSAQGETETIPLEGTRSLFIRQNGCNVSYVVPGTDLVGGLNRSGTVEGRNVRFSGKFLATPSDVDVSFSQNRVTLTGRINNINRFALSGFGQASGRLQGIPITCSGSSNGMFSRTTPVQDLDSDLVADQTDNCISVANYSQEDRDGDGRGDACDLDGERVIVTGDLDGNGLDDVIVDFSRSGTWVRYNNATWVKLHGGSPKALATGDMDGNGLDEVIFDFGRGGTWVRFNNATWVKLHEGSPEALATGDMDGNGLDEVIFDFGRGGTWVRFNNATWTKLHAGSPGVFATGDMDGNGLDEAIFDFGRGGTWVRYNNATWVKLHSLSPLTLATGDLNGNGLDEVILDYGQSGTRVRVDNAEWVELHSASPGVLAIRDRGDLSGGSSGSGASSGSAPQTGAPASDASSAFDGRYRLIARSTTKIGTDGEACGNASGTMTIVNSKVTGSVVDSWGYTYAVSGTVAANGRLSGGLAVAGNNVASYSGIVGNGRGSGTWVDIYKCAGTWSATIQ